MAKQGGSAAGLGRLEAEVMAVLWRSDVPLLVRQVVAALNSDRAEPLAYTTVMTVMSRLAGKGLLSRSRAGRDITVITVVYASGSARSEFSAAATCRTSSGASERHSTAITSASSRPSPAADPPCFATWSSRQMLSGISAGQLL